MQHPNDQEYNELYTNEPYMNELIPVRSISGPTDILTYDSLRGTERYVTPTYYGRRQNVPRKSAIFPEHYRMPAYFPYPGRFHT